MAGTIVLVRGKNGWLVSNNDGGWEYPAFWIVGLLVLAALGDGALQGGWAARVLAGFTLVASFFFHRYWTAPADQQMVMELLFMKNMAIVGGLLVIAALGAGPASLDERKTPGRTILPERSTAGPT